MVDEEEFNVLQQEFATILKKLLADNVNHKITHYGSSNEEKTTLDHCLALWNRFNAPRKLVCKDGINVAAQASGGEYPVIQMSDGEKAMLYLISLVSLAPKQSIIVVDEPEMHLHRTIIDTFWNTLEGERYDCLFIYLTHDLDFATSRTDAEKIWIKSFIYPERWETEAIPKNEIPEALLLELLGSKKNILFCEGNGEGYDKRIYAALFPKFTVTPVGGCTQVRSYTEAFNNVKMKEVTNLRAYGLVDRDYHEEVTLDKWKGKNVFGLEVSEVENLMISENLLSKIDLIRDSVEEIKREVVRRTINSSERQAARFVTNKINIFFERQRLGISSTKSEIKDKLENYWERIDVETWYEKRYSFLNNITEYDIAIRFTKGKALLGIVAAKASTNKGQVKRSAMQVILKDREVRQHLYKYFPPEIVEGGTQQVG